MQELDKILEEIDIKIAGSMGRKREGLLEARDIIRKHMNDRPCSECSRRKFYQAGYRDGKTDSWIPAKEKPTEDGFYIATMSGELVDQEEPFVGLAEFEDGEWVDGDDVIAWRLLPDPYRPERSR